MRAASPSSPAASPDSAPATAAPSPSRRSRKAATPSQPTGSAREGVRLRERLTASYEKARSTGDAFLWLKQKIEARPENETERRERVYAFRFLPAAALDEPARRDEIVALLRAHLGLDSDPDARLACAAVMGDAAIHLHDDGTRSMFWAGELLTPEDPAPDRRMLGLPLRDQLTAAYAMEPSKGNRMTLVQLLAEKPAASEAGFFRDVLQNDRDAASRELAVEALAALPPSPETVAVLRRTMEGDAHPVPRTEALAALVSLGAVDDLVVTRLLTAPPANLQTWELLGKAWSTAKPAAVGAYLRNGLESADAKVRAGALTAMAASGDKQFLPFIEGARGKESDEAVRKLFGETLQQLGKP